MLYPKQRIILAAFLGWCWFGPHWELLLSVYGADVKETLELLASEDAAVAGRAASTLGSHKTLSQAGIRLLAGRLGDDRDAQLYEGLGFLGPPTVGDYAADSLVQIGTEAVVKPICEFLATCDSEEGRIRAIRTLERLGPVAHASVDALAVCAQDEIANIRGWALQAIARVSANEDVTIALLRRGLKDSDSDVKGVAVRGLGNLGPRAAIAIPELLPLLDSTEKRGAGWDDVGWWEPLSMDVVMALGKIGPEAQSALPKLGEMVGSRDFRVRIAAAFAHCRISRTRTPGLDVLLEELRSDHELSVRQATESLGLLEYDQFLEPALEGLTKVLKHPDNLVRCRAARSIAAIAPADWIDLLRPLAKDPDGIVQDSVMNVFREHATEHPELLDIFVECLACTTGHEWKGMTGRRIAANALGKMGAHAKSAIPLLEKCAETDDDQRVREYAKEALQKITVAVSGECGPEGVNVLSHPEK